MIAGLPYDAEVEYLESTADFHQYIDTGITGNQLYAAGGLEVDCMPVSLSNYTPVANIDNDHNLNFLGLNNSEHQIYSRFNDVMKGFFDIEFEGLDSFLNVRIKQKALDGVATVTIGSSVKTWKYSQFCKDNTSHLFIFYGGSFSWWGGKFRVYHAKCWYNPDNVAFDFIPVRFTNEQGVSEGAMYDRVSRKLFRNAGTGAFVIGPDVATPVMGLHFMKLPKKTARNYVQDGLVAMWDGIENAGWGVHDNSATTWKDLIGGHVLNVDNGGSWADDCLVCDGTRRGAYGNNLTGDAPLVVEAVVQATTASSWRILWHQSEWRDGARLTRCLVFYNPMLLWLASAYGYTDVSTIIANKTAIHIDYTSSGISHLRINGSDAAFSTGATSWYNTDGGDVFAFGGASSTSASYALACKICSFRLYSRALTAAEVAHNYAVDKERFNLP